MACTYVKEFDFGGKKAPAAKYAQGGKVHSDAAMDKKAVKAAVHKHEKSLHKGEPLTKLARGGKMPEVRTMAKREMMATPTMEKKEVIQRESVKAPASPLGMLRDASRLGIEGNKNPGMGRRRMPVAPSEPMIPPRSVGKRQK